MKHRNLFSLYLLTYKNLIFFIEINFFFFYVQQDRIHHHVKAQDVLNDQVKHHRPTAPQELSH